MRFFGTMLVLFVALVLAVTPTALAKAPPEVIITKKCPAAAKQVTYKGNVVVYVSGGGCVSIDNGAVAIASGDAVVVAHGDSSVVAKDRTTLVVYNGSVACAIKGRNVTVVSAIGDPFESLRAKCAAVRPKRK